MKLIAGTSHPTLAASLAKCLGIPLVECCVEKFSNTEIKVQIANKPECNIRNEEVFILQTGGFNDHHSINDYIMEAMVLIDACRRSNAGSITLIMPYFPYSRQDKKDVPRVPISAKLMANMLSAAGVNRVISLDLHASQIQGFFDIPMDNLYAIKLFIQHLEETIFKGMTVAEMQKKYILVSPDNGGAKRVMAYSEYFKLNNVIMHKQRDHSKTNRVTKSILIGEFDLQDKTAIIIDDMADTMGTMVKASDNLIEHGIKDIILIVTHGILSGPAIDNINNSDNIKKVIVTNTLAQDDNAEKCSKLEVVDITDLLCNVVKCIVEGDSISKMF